MTACAIDPLCYLFRYLTDEDDSVLDQAARLLGQVLTGSVDDSMLDQSSRLLVQVFDGQRGGQRARSIGPVAWSGS